MDTIRLEASGCSCCCVWCQSCTSGSYTPYTIGYLCHCIFAHSIFCIYPSVEGLYRVQGAIRGLESCSGTHCWPSIIPRKTRSSGSPGGLTVSRSRCRDASPGLLPEYFDNIWNLSISLQFNKLYLVKQTWVTPSLFNKNSRSTSSHDALWACRSAIIVECSPAE